MRLTLVAGAFIALMGTSAAMAADMPVAPPPPPPPPVFVDPITAFFQVLFSVPQPVPPPPPPPVVTRKY